MNLVRLKGCLDGWLTRPVTEGDVEIESRSDLLWKVQVSGTIMKILSCSSGGGCFMTV
jgi:hypothetical protein